MRAVFHFVVLLNFLPYSLSFCPYKCECDNERLEASCIATNMEVMPMTLNPSMKTLILKYNNFHSVDASFKFYPELELVDLSHNQLVYIPDRAFSSQKRLIELRINNNKISQLVERTFSGLSKLQVLNLEENLIDRIPNRALHHLKSLKEINLRSNRISEIEQEAFVSLSQVTILDLSDNLLEIIPTDALRHMHNLAELKIAKNNIKLLFDQTFLDLFKLSILDLSGNKIERIHEKAFSHVSTIRELNLQDNELYEVPSSAFQSLSKLESLNIGQNKFSVIDENAFVNLGRLNRLEISGCSYLSEITQHAFSILMELEYVKIASNRKLNIIHHKAFEPLPNLKHFDLSNNALSSVSPDLIPWMELSSVDLSGNPWNCDCQNNFLKNVIVNTVNNSDSVRIVRCWNPPTLRDRDIAFLTMDCEIVQSPKTDRSSRTIDNTAILAVVCSSVITVILILSFILVKSRKSVNSCIKSTLAEPDHFPVQSQKILQYEPYQEPRYVSHYPTVQNHYPTVQTLKPVITLNPYQQTLFRHDQYFVTLDRQEQGIHQVDPDTDHHVKYYDDRIYQEDPCEERIYQGVDDTISEI